MAAGGIKLVVLWRALASALLLVGCGATEGSGSKPGAAGSSSAGTSSAGTSSAGTSSGGTSSGGTSSGGTSSGGGSGSGDLTDEFLGSVNLICEQIASCYPELQEPDSDNCTAPASNDRMVVYPRGDAFFPAGVEDCLRGYADQAELAEYMQCQLDGLHASVDCYASCPEDAEPCATAGNAAATACRDGFEGTGLAELNACYAASQ